jgi:hypothetical protein
MRKGQLVTVKGENGRGVTCNLVDIDYTDNKIWVRLPTNTVVEMNWNAKRNLYVGRMARIEFTVDPEQE